MKIKLVKKVDDLQIDAVEETLNERGRNGRSSQRIAVMNQHPQVVLAIDLSTPLC
jgi:hypothetical protein